MKENYLKSVKRQFNFYKVLGERTFDQLEDADLFWQPDPETNSISVMVNHLWGNMKSRWTDFLTSDGEKEWRQRDMEFEDVIKTRTQMMEKWEDGWNCLFEALDSITVENFETTVYIRNQGHTIIEAINRQMGHYPYHIGQIILIGRMIKKDQWISLSIPKGKSKEYNAEKFAQQKRKAHFTDEFLDDNPTESK